jgi:NAD(P)-dependent dehydrogenase (short-subunit alcohol dehydrogenase family)
LTQARQQRGLFDLTGRVVLATGGASGIGLAFLTGCARQGAQVVVWDKAADKIPAVLEALRATGAPKAYGASVDVSDEQAVAEAFQTTVAEMGRVDGVLANAGITSRAPSFPDMTSEMYHQLLAVNLHGAFFTLRETARHMRERAQAGDPGGSIAVTGSLSIFHGLQGMEHYAGAKGALAAMVKGLAVELGQYGVRVNMLAPGFILTGMTDDSIETQKVVDRMSSITPLGRPGNLADIEGPSAYLMAEASRFQTGDIMVIDGGRRVKSL